MQIIICKFGGTSVSNRARWDNILAIVQSHIKARRKPVVVCSALSQASNQLEKAIESALSGQHQSPLQSIIDGYSALAKELCVNQAILQTDFQQLQQWLEGIALLQEAPAKIKAQIMSLGEIMMSRLGQSFLQQSLSGVSLLDARDIIRVKQQRSDPALHFLAARTESEADNELITSLQQDANPAAITQGFIAADEKGQTVLLGRGGSDTSAALIAVSSQAQGCEIWTDVPGIYTANPYQLPNARLLKQLNYNEAQEIATMGAKVLHPGSIPPVRRANIPLWIKYSRLPAHSGTLISADRDETAPPIKSIQVKHQILLVSIDTSTMWQEVGFLADVFQRFKQHGFSVDLLSSSEFNITVSLDTNARLRERGALDSLLNDLQSLGRARLIEPCSAVSLVGHPIRTILPELGPTLAVFEAQQVHMMCLASNDLNLTFVVDESQADKLCQKLHSLLIENNPQSYYYSKSWQEEFGKPDTLAAHWWEKKRKKLLDIGKKESPCYVYDLDTVRDRTAALQTMDAIDKLYYAVKANPNPEIIRTLAKAGIAFECVSRQEIDHVCQTVKGIKPDQILFTPNFAAREEYEFALEFGCYVTIDNRYILEQWPEIFHKKPVILRIDPGSGAGHHKYVCTGGNESKFGIVREDIDRLLPLIRQHRIEVIGLHSHSGSGILSPEQWQQTTIMLVELAQRFEHVRIINCGGGLGVVEKPWQKPLDLQAVNASLQAVKATAGHLQFWLEPGRYYVAEAGVLLAKVTQLKEKGSVRFIGLETGMNSLLRPALYGAWHEIVNLSHLEAEKQNFHHIVGPICESGDTLGYDRLLPATYENDIMLVATAGAYGYCMHSEYNLRPAAVEYCLP